MPNPAVTKSGKVFEYVLVATSLLFILGWGLYLHLLVWQWLDTMAWFKTLSAIYAGVTQGLAMTIIGLPLAVISTALLMIMWILGLPFLLLALLNALFRTVGKLMRKRGLSSE